MSEENVKVLNDLDFPPQTYPIHILHSYSAIRNPLYTYYLLPYVREKVDRMIVHIKGQRRMVFYDSSVQVCRLRHRQRHVVQRLPEL